MQLAEVYGAIRQAGCDLWALAPQEPAINAAMKARYALPFPILADEHLEVIHTWGLFNDRDPKGRAIPYPAVYHLGSDRRVLWAAVSETTRDRPATEELLTHIRALSPAA